MDIKSTLDFLSLMGQLKMKERHCVLENGRTESVAEHCFRLACFSWLLRDEFAALDMDKVMCMCLLHDMGEAVTGDIPVFDKTKEDEDVERDALAGLAKGLSGGRRREWEALFSEMEKNETDEARLFHALDKLEAVISHNESDISTWLALEHELQLTHGSKEAEAFAFTKRLREQVRRDTQEKLRQSK